MRGCSGESSCYLFRFFLSLSLAARQARHSLFLSYAGQASPQARGFDAVQVFVDRLTKTKRLVATHATDDSQELARVVLHAVIGPYGMRTSKLAP